MLAKQIKSVNARIQKFCIDILYKIQYDIANYTNYENLFYNPFSILVLKTDLILLKSSPKGEGVNPIPANYIKILTLLTSYIFAS
ncbi:MAG: hypothetical protein HEEMFOPI_01816 [Holosporales bacterium]